MNYRKAGMRMVLRLLSVGLVLIVMTGCSLAVETGKPSPIHAVSTPDAALRDPIPPSESFGELSLEDRKTLSSLEMVDDYPLYTMRYYGSYETEPVSLDSIPQLTRDDLPEIPVSMWACSLFSALDDPEYVLLGRNFDWEYSPALLLFTDPPDGYASVSMVDIAYIGFEDDEIHQLIELSLDERTGLLMTPFLPFDGMNACGLGVGMAAVSPGNMAADPQKQSIGSLGVIREILDHACDIEDAVEIIQRYNIDMAGGPPLHYLIADRSGKAVLVEFYQGEMVLIPNQESWHQATNFLRSAYGESAEGVCDRYDTIADRLTSTGGQLDMAGAMDLLGDVSQIGTQWSIVYGLSDGELQVVMGREYDPVLPFQLNAIGEGID
jgi:hypothetical protein